MTKEMTDFSVIGIDPGLTCTGFCVIEIRSGELGVAELGVLKSDKDERLDNRIALIVDELEKQADGVDIVCVEDCYIGPNAQGALKQAELIGVIWDRFRNKGLISVRVAPKRVKKLFTGNGNAGKPLMVKTAEKHIKVKLDGSKAVREAKADAFAIALSGLKEVSQMGETEDEAN